MPQTAYPQTVRVVCELGFYGEKAVNVWHVRNEVVGGVFDLHAGLAGAFRTFYNGLSTDVSPARGTKNFRPNVSVLQRITVQNLHAVPYATPTEFAYTDAGSGGDCAFVEVCAAISLRTGVASRRARGRIFFGPLGVSTWTGMGSTTVAPTLPLVLANALCIGVQDLASRIEAIDADLHLAVLSQADAVSRNVTSVKVDYNPDIQRRRGKGLAYAPPVILAV